MGISGFTSDVFRFDRVTSGYGAGHSRLWKSSFGHDIATSGYAGRTGSTNFEPNFSISRPTSHVIEPSTPRIQFYTPYQRTFRPPNRAVQNNNVHGHSTEPGTTTVHVRPKEKKQESKTKVIDTNGGFDCRICLESLLDIRNKSIDVSFLAQVQVQHFRHDCNKWQCNNHWDWRHCDTRSILTQVTMQHL